MANDTQIEVVEPIIDDEETIEDGDDEILVPAIEEEEEEKDEEEKETVDEVVEKVKEEVKPEPKPVEGETPREVALRKQITELREKIRDKDEVIKIADPVISNEEYEKLKGEYADEELEKFEKLFSVVGKKLGYVKTEDVNRDKGQDVLNKFLDTHTEYKVENDPSDERWKMFTTILNRDYNRNGKTPVELAKLFEKVNRDVAEELGESPKRVIAPRTADIQKIKSVSHAGGTKTQTEVVKKSNAPTDPTIRKMFKGFDDDDF
jgi:hypothetical protein